MPVAGGPVGGVGTAVPGPQPMSTTRSADVSPAASAAVRATGPRPAVIESAVMIWQARPAYFSAACDACVLVVLIAVAYPPRSDGLSSDGHRVQARTGWAGCCPARFTDGTFR
jgi:hypothetical protein